jgi:hypothetical protein
MSRKFGYLLGGAGMAVAMLAFAVTLEAEVAPPGPRFDPTAVNRTLKSDRLPLIPAATGGARPVMAPSQIKGKSPSRMCPQRSSHDMFSPEVAGRCLA